jgi:hypothetical protein
MDPQRLLEPEDSAVNSAGKARVSIRTMEKSIRNCGGSHLDSGGAVSAVFPGEVLESWGAGFQCLQSIYKTLRFSQITPLNIVYQLHCEV